MSTDVQTPSIAPVAELREVQGPSALGGGWRRFFDLLWLISVTEFKRVYFGTVLGYLWSLLRPLFLFSVLLFVFTQIFRVGSGEVEHYPVFLLMGIVLYTFFSEATGVQSDGREHLKEFQHEVSIAGCVHAVRGRRGEVQLICSNRAIEGERRSGDCS